MKKLGKLKTEMNFKTLKILFLFFTFFVSVHPVFSQTNGFINLVSESGSNKFSSGDFLSFSLKLVNFGSISRQDVTITYQITDSQNNEVYVSSETVAVDTTASFVKRIPLPDSLKSGLYTLSANLIYPGQQQVATSKFTFSIESKIGGFFISDLIIYGLSSITIIIFIIIIVYFFTRKLNKNRVFFFNYSDKPKNEIVYYEILSDMINQMRFRIGNDAIELAQEIPNLQIDSRSGKVINIAKEPAKIIALLIHRFEEFSGHKMSFGLRPKK